MTNKQITFKTLTIQGFGSIIKPLSYVLNRTGLNIVSGKNGSGKTSIFSAFSWVLTGKTLKEKSSIEPWKHIKPKGYTGVIGSVTFEKGGVEYKVIRCKDYKEEVPEIGQVGKSRLIILKGGKSIEDTKDKRDLQKDLTAILGFSYDLMINSILFGQKLKRIIEEGGAKKKEIFDEAFEADYLNKARELGVKHLKEYQQKAYEIEPKVGVLIANIKGLKARIEDARNYEAQFTEQAERLTTNLKRAKEDLAYYSKELNKMPSRANRLKHLQAVQIKVMEYDKLQQGVNSQLASAYTDHRIAVQAYEHYKNETVTVFCPTCKRRLDKDKVLATAQALKKSKEEGEASIKSLKKKLDKYQADYDSYTVKIAELLENLGGPITNTGNLSTEVLQLKGKLADKDAVERKVKRAEADIIAIQKDLASVGKAKKVTDIPKLQLELRAFRKELRPLKIRLRRIEKKVALYEWVVTSPLSNSGIKIFIFERMLEQVNKRLKYYASYLYFTPEFVIEGNARKDIKSRVYYANGDEVAYEDLSGGQQQLIDITNAFAIHDIVNDKIPCNILIMDELFKHLDEDNIEIVSELIRMKSKGRAIHLITHEKEFDAKNAHITTLELDSSGRTEQV